MFLDKELDEIIKESLNEARLELSDSGKLLNISCDFKNGNSDTCANYSNQIDTDDFSKEDKARLDRLSKLCEISL